MLMDAFNVLLVRKSSFLHHLLQNCQLISNNCSNFHPRGRGMPPRGGSARGAVSRGGPARGGAVRGGPAGRGGLPSTPTRGAVAPRARPPASGPPQRMGPPPPHNPATAAESYEEYVSVNKAGRGGGGVSTLSVTRQVASETN